MARPLIEPFLAGGEALAEAVGRGAELEQVAAVGEPVEERRGHPLVIGEDARPALRRKRAIGRFPGETSCLTLAWAIMDLVIAGGRGLGLTLPERQEIAAW